MRRRAGNPAPCACDWCAEDADAHDEAMQEMWD